MQVMGLGNGKWIFVLAAISLTGCGSDSTAPSSVAGTYLARSFVTTSSAGQITNQLASGSDVQLTLRSDGTTTGQLHVAASGSVPAFDADMAGTWTLTGNTVTFTQAADTFVRNMTFTVTHTDSSVSFIIFLTGDMVFPDGTRVQLTLGSLSRV